MFTQQVSCPKYIIDSDIGDDVDDAFAVAMAFCLHRDREINLQCVMTSGKGNHQKRAGLIHSLQLSVFGGTAPIPIVCGLTPGESNCNYMALGETTVTFPTLEDVAEDILRTISESSQTTILCIGPLDNIMYLKPPPDRVRMVLMGGCFGHFFDGQQAPPNFPEYNVKKGVLSWRFVLSNYRNTLVVPLDIAGQGRIPNWSRLVASEKPVAAVLATMYRAWYDANFVRYGAEAKILRDVEGRSVALNGAVSHIQFDSVALFAARMPSALNIIEAPVVVHEKGQTTVADTGPPVRIAMAWSDEGLARFQSWFQQYLF